MVLMLFPVRAEWAGSFFLSITSDDMSGKAVQAIFWWFSLFCEVTSALVEGIWTSYRDKETNRPTSEINFIEKGNKVPVSKYEKQVQK